jgi:hypothetical protein
MGDLIMSYNPVPPQAPKGAGIGKVLAFVAAGILALCGIGALVVAVAAPEDNRAARLATVPDRGVPPTVSTPSPSPAERAVLLAADVTPSIKIRSKDCIDFETIPDSCTYTYEVNLSVPNLDKFKAAGDSYSVTYSVRGLKGGEQIDTIELDAEGNYSAWPGFGTAGPKAKLTVKIVSVEVRP